MGRRKFITIAEMLLGAGLLFLIYREEISSSILQTGTYLILFLFIVWELAFLFLFNSYKLYTAKREVYSLAFLFLFVLLFFTDQFFLLKKGYSEFSVIPPAVIILRGFLTVTGIFGRFNKLTSVFDGISLYPAQTILLSFLSVILIGTILLLFPFVTVDGKGLSLINSLFTSTSAVCVTGLIVVDTATVFTIWGKIIILVLIQTGGIGIMILSYFTIFTMKKRVSIKEKLTLSYMLNENDMTHIVKSIQTIIYTSFIIEGIGTLLLIFPFRTESESMGQVFFLSLFHAVSAFCNAGFSLFTGSLERYRDNLSVNLTIGFLVILGGLSFVVIHNLVERTKNHTNSKLVKLQVNSKVVLITTAILLLSGTILVYGLEYTKTMAGYSLSEQYLAAFFQSITLRTAGFNTIPFTGLTTTTLMVMAVFMFIGAAAGSTAGGIKINNLAVIFAYIRSFVTKSRSVVLLRHSIPKEKVLKSMLILFFGISAVTLGIIVLSYTEHSDLKNIAFETVSAFGTVGLSTGLTPTLSITGKLVIIFLMFMGRLGPLTILAAASGEKRKIRIEFPVGDISIG